MIEFENVSVTYPGAKEPALTDVNITFQKGEFVCVLGRSGAGKSTFIRCINGLQPVSEGYVKWGDKTLSEMTHKETLEVRRKTGMIFQHFNLIPRMSVVQNILTGLFGYKKSYENLLGLFKPTDRLQALEAIEQVELTVEPTRRVEKLSGGQKQRVAIARALVQNPKVFLGDEPVASLDPGTAERIFQLLKETHVKRNLVSIINVHDVVLAKKFATRIIALKNGKLVFDGAPKDFDETVYAEIYNHL
ncbi:MULTISPECIES: phosphonate ABC transporter ATP-binding protein [Fictibacillus]|jgi:phosphonate transport system ATP-binding protein|uniref:phosphonate ABC transporter ATP-binding protein n=1 Tax=Fictibacillus TaxID=1329200 RepID=UPI0018CF4E44|nr:MULTISPECIES: phosphonate ABC transporter ATP-binding protein [unclassified Fictibacillus]MBH0160864.1 phosphonate ABC transporter ATP-binding protein [Fictibacillus sp. 26RED30]MBH0165756.1 phosphonate ABC transporter ATP-binding protein [Fictibacillus sp. 7GRE50]MBH0173195.1 phosphonate ABC transporter ATP-binding protein [Fictibacillus sp. 23RED33]